MFQSLFVCRRLYQFHKFQRQKEKNRSKSFFAIKKPRMKKSKLWNDIVKNYYYDSNEYNNSDSNYSSSSERDSSYYDC